MHQRLTTQRHPSDHRGRRASEAHELGASSQNRPSFRCGVMLAGLVVATTMGLQSAQAEEVAEATVGASVFGSSPQTSMVSLEDGDLASIRGRFAHAGDIENHSKDFVILWDEQPAGGSSSGNKGAGQSVSTGFGNQQSTSVTTRRGQ